MRTFIIAFAFLLASSILLGRAAPTAAQETLRLTLPESITMAQAQSPAAEMARLQRAQARWDNQAFQAQYLPAFSLTGSAPGLQRSITDILQDDGTVRYIEQSRTFSSMRLTVDQPIPQTGGRLFASSGLSRTQQFGGLDFGEWQSSPLLVGVQQPIFQFNAMRWNRRLQPLQYEAAERSFTEDLEAIAVDITDLFFDVYLAQMNVDIDSFNVAVNDTVFTLARGRFEIGRIAENDLLQSELALLNAQTALSNARTNYERALQNLRTALGLPYDATIQVIPPATVPSLQVDAALAVEEARRNRAAFIDLDIQALQADRAVAQARRTNGFSANMTASFGLNQSAGSLNSAYQSPLNQQAFSLNFEIPIYQWGRGKAEVASALAGLAEAERRIRLQREELSQDVYFEAIQLIQQQQQVAIAAKADTVAARRFEVARNRYGVGNIDITDLFNAQAAKDSARRAYIQTLRSFWTSYFRLRRLTLYDFARGERLTARP